MSEAMLYFHAYLNLHMDFPTPESIRRAEPVS
jgi:hypothetical protein